MEFSSIIYPYFRDMVKNKCIESGIVCHHWVNDQIAEDLLFLDKKDNGNRWKTYLKQCHEPRFHYTPHDNKVWITCHNIDMQLGNFCSDRCKYSNDKVAREIVESEFKNP